MGASPDRKARVFADVAPEPNDPDQGSTPDPGVPGRDVEERARDESRLIRAARAGDDDAFGELVERYRDRVYGVAFRMVGNAEDAMDIAQQAFVKAWRSLPRFRGASRFYTWMYRITANLCLDHLRARRPEESRAQFDDAVLQRRSPDVVTAPSANPSPRREVALAELRERIGAALERLTPEHRAVIVLREYEGLSYREIAQSLGCRIGTVMSRLHYARDRLRELLGEAG